MADNNKSYTFNEEGVRALWGKVKEVAGNSKGEGGTRITYEEYEKLEDKTGVYYVSDAPGGEGGSGGIATTEKVGVVKPDGVTIFIDEDGTIHAEQHSFITVKFNDDVFAGMDCVIESDTYRYTATINDELKAIFDIKELGTLKVMCGPVSHEYNIYNYANYALTIPRLVDIWLEKGQVTEAYDTLDDVLADEITVRKLMTVHASSDFLIEWYNSFNNVLDTIIASNYAMKWIGLRDYICDKFMVIDEVKTAFLESDNWECILKDHVPIMTSNTAPYGEVSASSSQTTNTEYRIFANGGWCSAVGDAYKTNQWVQYKFICPICVKRFSWAINNSNNNVKFTNPPKNYEIRASNDGITWETLYEAVNPSTTPDETFDVTIDNNEYYIYYRFFALDGYYTDASAIRLNKLQFYGRSLNVSVPTMTSNTEPYGEVIFNVEESSNPACNAFNKVLTNAWSTGNNAPIPSYIGYKFNKPIAVKMFSWTSTIYVNCDADKIKLEGSNDGLTWVELTDEVTPIRVTNRGDNKITFFTSTNINAYNEYRVLCISYFGTTFTGFASADVNFYGVDYSEREFAPDSTMKYIYDHGIEFEELHYHTDGVTKSIAENNGNYLRARKDGVDNVGWAEIDTESIDLTNYKLVRWIYAHETLIPTNSGGYSGFVIGVPKDGSGHPLALKDCNWIATATPVVPYNSCINITNVNQAYKLAVIARLSSTSIIESSINEIWLE